MSDRESEAKPFDHSGRVSVENGHVLVDGPDGVAIALTAAAAREMGRRLIAAADEIGASQG